MPTITLAANGHDNFTVTYDNTTCVVSDGVTTRKFIYTRLLKPSFTPHNALLFQLTPHKYLYAGLPIQIIKSKDRILSFESPDAIHNEVPYAYATTAHNILLLNHGILLPKVICGDPADPYASYYLHDHPSLKRALGTWLDRHSTYSFKLLKEFKFLATM